MECAISLLPQSFQKKALCVALSLMPGAATFAASLEEVIVTAQRATSMSLNTATATGSRLDTPVAELPASLDVVNANMLTMQGLRTASEALQAAVGVTVGDGPAEPVAFSIRGFTYNQIPTLYDGIKVGPASFTARPMDIFNLERVEVLRGPSSGLYGDAAIGGVVNYVTKRPARGPFQGEAIFSYGSYDTQRYGIGVGGPLTGEAENSPVYYRFDAVHQDSNGYVDDTASDLTNITSAVLIDFTEKTSLQLSLDYKRDNANPYWGTPLVPKSFAGSHAFDVVKTDDGRVIDERMRDKNYNVDDNYMKAEEYWLRGKLEHEFSDVLKISNELYSYKADRNWFNAEQYIFDPAAQLIGRDRFYVFHNQTVVGNRLELNASAPLFGLDNNIVAGLDWQSLDFKRRNGGDNSDVYSPTPIFTDLVDPFDPVGGSFDTGSNEVGPFGRTRARIDTTAVFIEDRLQLGSDWAVHAALRSEEVTLESEGYSAAGVPRPASTFEHTWHGFAARLGVVYSILSDTHLYAQFANASDPASSSSAFLLTEDQASDQSDAQQWELGVKHSFADRQGESTLAVYSIKREDFFTKINQFNEAKIDEQTSRGIEAAIAFSVLPNWQLRANATYTEAEFSEFIVGASSYSGNRPGNVPEKTANLVSNVNFSAGVPLSWYTGVRYVGDRYADNGNSVFMKEYLVVDTALTAEIEGVALTFRVRNLFDEDYAVWSDPYYTRQIQLGTPRSYEIGARMMF